uniref:Secreted protein n=1 Tax=Steinernema glaseri TaxID=37863 RepID=A0A1I7ZB61_9BILA
MVFSALCANQTLLVIATAKELSDEYTFNNVSLGKSCLDDRYLLSSVATVRDVRLFFRSWFLHRLVKSTSVGFPVLLTVEPQLCARHLVVGQKSCDTADLRTDKDEYLFQIGILLPVDVEEQ